MRVAWAAAAVAVAVGCSMAGATNARAASGEEAEPEAFARVIVDMAELRTGPGASYRVIYEAHRGETFALDGRPSAGEFWLRVLLPDGRAAYALGDEVQPFAVDPNAEGAPSRPGLFAPPPLEGSRIGVSLVGGALSVPFITGGTQGYVEARPSLVIHKTVSLEGFIGDGLTQDGTELLYGGGVSIYLAPSWPICPFVGLFGGGFSLFPNPDSFVLQRHDYFVARAGGGILMALRNRILLRIEGTELSVFDAETYRVGWTVAGGLGVYF